MTVPEVLTPDDEARWRELLPSRRSVFGGVEFARIQQRHDVVEPRLFTLRSAQGPIAHPLLLRPISGLPFAIRAGEGLFDAATPPYCGPLVEEPPSAATAQGFAEALSAWCAETGVVTEFGHLHPWTARTELLARGGVERDREIVYVDLSLDEERMWRESFTHACRKNINRARGEGVRVRRAATESDVRELHRIYEMTMNRQGALEGYYFPPEYFASFLELAPDNAVILLAERDGRVIAATLYLHDDADVYSYLGGADRSFQRLRPTNALVDEIIRWGRERGKRRLVLGGGYGPGDGILRFKGSFSPLRAHFHVYRHVHIPEAFEGLCVAWRHHHGAETTPGRFFPPYRGDPDQPAGAGSGSGSG